MQIQKLTKYKYEGNTYNSFSELKYAYPYLSFPKGATSDVLLELGIETVDEYPPLEYCKELMLAKIDTWTASQIVGGFMSNCTGENVKYDSDKDTQITMQGIALNVHTELFALKYPDGCPVRGYASSDNLKSIFLLSPEQVMQWQVDLSEHIGNCKQSGWQKQAAVQAAESVEELLAIVLSD